MNFVTAILKPRINALSAVVFILVVIAISSVAADRPGSTSTPAPEIGAALALPVPRNLPQSVFPAPTYGTNVPVLTSVPPTLETGLAASNGLSPATMTGDGLNEQFQKQLELARYLRFTRQPAEATPILVSLLADHRTPQPTKQAGLLELALVAQDQNDLAQAEQIYAQFLSRWPNDLRIPEMLLRQGQVFRDMGLNNLALAKFYAVMTSALVLKNDQIDYYQRLVLQAQIEIAETHYQLGRYADAADFFSRLLKLNNPLLDRATVQFRLVRSLAALNRNDETVAQAQDYLAHYTDTPQQPEVRFYLAVALKQLTRNGESLEQVLLLLREERERTKGHPEVWAYWQRRTGNEIANQLYREGDYTKALDIYLSLVELDSSLEWRLPVDYQIGMTYEHLLQPHMALTTYTNILASESVLGTNASPGLKAVIDMARWRSQFIGWQEQAEVVNHDIAMPPTNTTSAANTVAPVIATQ